MKYMYLVNHLQINVIVINYRSSLFYLVQFAIFNNYFPLVVFLPTSSFKTRAHARTRVCAYANMIRSLCGLSRDIVIIIKPNLLLDL